MSSSVNDYSPQAVFDETVRHLARQGGPSLRRYDGILTCMYRGTGGQKCAVGFWIPDEAYRRNMEKTPITDGLKSEIVQAAIPEPMRTKRILSLLESLQQAHDAEYNWEEKDGVNVWRVTALNHALREIAYKRKLRVGVIKECFP
jgi:hypothetical protein